MEGEQSIRDFAVRINEMALPDGKGVLYTAHVTTSPRGSTEPEALNAPFVNEQLENLSLRLQIAVMTSKGYRNTSFASPDQKVLQQFGQVAFDSVFRHSKGVSRQYEDCKRDIEQNLYQGLRIKMEVIPHRLASLPWEFMFDEKDNNYLCLASTSPVLRHMGDLGNRSLKLGRRIKILAMIADPTDYGDSLNVEQERAVLQQVSEEPNMVNRIQLSWVTGQRLEDLIDHINRDRWDIFHFIGHGGYDPDDRTGFVVMGNGKGGGEAITAPDLANVLGLCDSLRMVVLNCCDSGHGNGPESPAAALSRARIPVVVAMQYPVPDRSAIAFTKTFYSTLAVGKTVEHSLTAARNAMKKNTNMDWGIPVLFSRLGADFSMKFWDEGDAAEVVQPAAVVLPIGAEPAQVHRSESETELVMPPVVVPPDAVSDLQARREERRKRVQEMFRQRP